MGDHQSSHCASVAVRETTKAIDAGTQVISQVMTESLERLGYETQDTLAYLAGDLAAIQADIAGLHDFLHWSHSEAIWRMEQQIELLTGIHDMLKNPSATQVNELYEMAVDSFSRDRFGDAAKLLQRARDLNPGDYRVLVTLGHTCIRMDELSEAVEMFTAAADYARTDEYRKDALLLLSRALRSSGRNGEAVRAARQATALVPDDAPAAYELAAVIAESVQV